MHYRFFKVRNSWKETLNSWHLETIDHHLSNSTNQNFKSTEEKNFKAGLDFRSIINLILHENLTKKGFHFSIVTQNYTFHSPSKYFLFLKKTQSRCLKITEKVLFNIASEASYVYILSGQNFIKISNLAKFWKPKACGQSVLPDKSVLIGQKLMENVKKANVDVWKIVKIRHLRSHDAAVFSVSNWIICVLLCTLMIHPTSFLR